MIKLMLGICAAALIGSSPAWGGDDDDYDGRGRESHEYRNADKHLKNERRQWRRQRRDHYYEERSVYRYYEPAPRIVEQHYYPAPRMYSPPPGVHVVLPDLYFPF